jgi:hypothetical protein
MRVPGNDSRAALRSDFGQACGTAIAKSLPSLDWGFPCKPF